MAALNFKISMFIAFGKLKSLHKKIVNSAYKNQTEKINLYFKF